MKKTILASIAAIVLPSFVFAGTTLSGSSTQTQTFSYVPSDSASLSFYQFNASAILDAKNVTLTSVILTLDITKTGGSIQADNDSAVSGNVSLVQTVTLTLTGKNFLPDPLKAVSNYDAPIGATTGDSTSAFTSLPEGETSRADYIDSDLFVSVTSSTTTTLDNAYATFGGYIGSGSYTITATGDQTSVSKGLSGVAVAYSPASVSGKVTVTYIYEYEAVPEPSTWAMLIGGTGVLLVGQRLRRRLS